MHQKDAPPPILTDRERIERLEQALCDTAQALQHRNNAHVQADYGCLEPKRWNGAVGEIARELAPRKDPA